MLNNTFTINVTRKSIFTVFLVFISGSLVVAQSSAYTNPLGMEFVLVKPGSFVLGRFQPTYPKPADHKDSDEGTYSPEEYKRAEMMAKRDTRRGFKVEIKKAFFIGRYEVTQEQWKKVMGNNPSVFQGDKISADGERHPVENITRTFEKPFIDGIGLPMVRLTYPVGQVAFIFFNNFNTKIELSFA